MDVFMISPVEEIVCIFVLAWPLGMQGPAYEA